MRSAREKFVPDRGGLQPHALYMWPHSLYDMCIKWYFYVPGVVSAAVAGSFSCAVADNWNYNGSNPCLHCGGNYSQNQNHGLFYVNYNTASNANTNIGCRILVFVRLL